MATVKRFEELEIWQMAREQCRWVWQAIREKGLQYDLPTANQINASSGSVMDNIAEGFDRFSRAEFRQFLVIARGSNAEVRSQWLRCIDRKHIDENDGSTYVGHAEVLGIRITRFIQYLDGSTYKQKAKGSNTSNTNSSQHLEEAGAFYDTEKGFIDEYVVPDDFLASPPQA